MPLNDIVRNLLIRLTVDAEGASKDIDKASKQFSGLQKNLDGLSRTFTGIGAGLTAGITLPIAGATTAAFKFSTDFNAAMANVATLIPGNVSRVNELKGSVQTLAIETGKSTADIAGGLFQVISAFGDSADSVKLLEINARAAAAGLATTEDSINLTSAVTKGYGDTSAEAAQKAADLAFKTNELGQTTFPELAASLGQVVPIASTLAVSQEELFAGFAALTGVTGNTAEVSTQLRAAMVSLVKPTEEMQSAIKALGFESGSALVAQKGLQGALQELVGTTNGSAEAITTLTGRQEAMQAVLAITGSQADKFSSSLDSMRNASGSVDAALKEQTEGVNALGFTFAQLQVRLEVLAQRLGDTLAPAFKVAIDVADDLIGALETGVKVFGELPAPVQTAAIAIAGLAAAAGPVLVVLGTMAGSISSLIGLLPTLTGAFGTTGTGAVTLAGSLTVAKSAVVAMGQAAIVAAAAFAAWELGRWAAENIPVVQKLGDVLVELIDPLGQLREHLSGNREAQLSLQEQTETLAKSIKDKFGIEIERGTKTLEEWSKELRKAATELTGAEKKTDAIRDSLKKQNTVTVEAAKGTQAFNSALSNLGKQTKKTEKTIADIVKSMEDEAKQAKKVAIAQQEYAVRHSDAAKAVERARFDLEKFTEELQKSERAQQSLARAISGEAVPAINDAARASAAMVISLTNTIPPIANTEQGFYSLREALGGFGIKAQSVAQNELEVLRQQLEVIRQQAAQGNPDALAALSEAEKRYAEALKGASGPVQATGLWSDALKQVSTVITDLGKSIAQDLGQHIKTGIGFIDSMTEAVLRLVSERVLGAVIKHFQTLKDFIPSLSNIKDLLKDIGSALGIGTQVAGTAGQVAGGVAGTAGDIAGAAGDVGGAAGTATSGTLGTVASVTGIVTGIVSAVTGVIGVFQNAKQETTLNAIELNTRQTTRVLDGSGGFSGGVIGQLFRIGHALEFGTFVKVLEQIRDDVRGTIAPALAKIAATGVMVAGLSQVAATAETIATNTETTAENTATIPELPERIAVRTRSTERPVGEELPAGAAGPVRGRSRLPLTTVTPIETPAIETPAIDPTEAELRRRNPLAFGSNNPLASLLLGGRNPLTFEPIVSAVQTGANDTGMAITDLSSVFRARLDRSNEALTQINAGIQAGAARPIEFHAHFEGATFTDEAQFRRYRDELFREARIWGKGMT